MSTTVSEHPCDQPRWILQRPLWKFLTHVDGWDIYQSSRFAGDYWVHDGEQVFGLPNINRNWHAWYPGSNARLDAPPSPSVMLYINAHHLLTR